MAAYPQSNLKRTAFGALSAVLLTGIVAIGSTSAESARAGCYGDYVANVNGGTLTSYADGGLGWATSYTFPTSIPAGTYDLNGAGSDAYAGRSQAEAQLNERWYAQLIGANGNVVATSSSTADLQDGVEAASWAGGLGLVSFDTNIVSIRTVHAYQTTADTNSVHPACVGFSALQVAPPTTEAPEPEPELETPVLDATLPDAQPTEPAPQATPTTTAPTTRAPATPAPNSGNNRPAFTG